jgi:hypothetical protein
MSTSGARCPWCSAALPDPAADKCPSCSAQLVHESGTEPNLPGVTALDPEAILRSRSDASRSRGGLLGFLTGRDLPETSVPESAGSLAPPDNAVRREMLRLQFEAEQADAVAETVALRSDVLAERGVPLEEFNAAEQQAEEAYRAEVEGGQPSRTTPPAVPAPAAPTIPPVPPAPDAGPSEG